MLGVRISTWHLFLQLEPLCVMCFKARGSTVTSGSSSVLPHGSSKQLWMHKRAPCILLSCRTSYMPCIPSSSSPQKVRLSLWQHPWQAVEALSGSAWLHLSIFPYRYLNGMRMRKKLRCSIGGQHC